MSASADRRRPMAAGCAAIALWGALATLSVLAGPVPPFQMVAMTFALGAAIGIVRARRRGLSWKALVGWPGRVWLLGIGGLFGYHALYFAALQLAPPAEANLVNYLWPLLIVLLSAPILGLHLGPRRLAGVALGFLGCALLVGAGASFPAGAFWGFACAVGCAVVWAVYSVTSKRMAAVPTEAVAGFCIATALLAGVTSVAFETLVMPDARQWIAILLLGAGPLGAAFFLWDAGMKRGDPRLLGTLAYAVPVASTLLLVVAGEGALDWRVGLAALLVAGGGLLAATARDGVTPARR